MAVRTDAAAVLEASALGALTVVAWIVATTACDRRIPIGARDGDRERRGGARVRDRLADDRSRRPGERSLDRTCAGARSDEHEPEHGSPR